MSIDLSYVIPPIDRKILKEELTQGRFVRNTNKGGNEIYIINHHNSPNTMKEIGRLREIAFAGAGGGTGLPLDIDEHDTNEQCYEQLIVYSPEDDALTGGYRFKYGKNAIDKNGNIDLSTAHYFNFSSDFLTNYLPYSIELGRSWVNPDYQPSKNPRKGLFALDNLWDGLGSIVHLHPQMKYFFGKVTMYKNYNIEARKGVLGFMMHYFGDKENLVTPIHPIYLDVENSEFIKSLGDKPFKEGLKDLQQYCRQFNENIPPLINNYMQLSPTMKSFGTAENPDFGGVEETGILVTLDDIYLEKKERHLEH